MRRIKTVLAVIAVLAAVLVVFAAPAMANDHWDWDDDDFDSCWFFGVWVCDDFDDDFFFDDGFGFGDNDQEAESGDIDQSFDVSGTGDNSNQTVGIQGVANTGNVQNQLGVTDAGDFSDFRGEDDFCDIFDCDEDDFFGDNDNDGDFEFDDGGSSIVVSPTNITSSDQQVNQAASASG